MIENEIFLNENFSNAGKNSAEKYNIKNIINFNEKNKSKRFKNIFEENEEEKSNNLDEEFKEEIDIFDKNYTPNKTKKEEQKNQIPKNFNKSFSTFFFNKDQYKYHNKNLIEQSKKKEKNLSQKNLLSHNKYIPNIDFIKAKTISGPKWKSLTGRKENIIEEDLRDFYIENNKKKNYKGFVEMKKQTMRIYSPNKKDVRLRYEKKYTFDNKKKSNQQKNDNNNNNNDNFFIQKIFKTKYNPNMFKPHPIYSSKNRFKSINKLLKINKFFYNNSHHSSFSSLNILNLNNENNKNKNKSSNSILIDHIKSIPDFKKTISRAKLNKLEKKNISDLPFLNPNFKIIKERSPMMVIYNKSNSNKTKQDFKGIDSSMNFDANKCYFINHKEPTAPIFKYMKSKPSNKDSPLPSFMYGLCSRGITYAFSAYTLKMNNYANGRFFDNSSCFNNKKSFNKFVNLSLINDNSKEINIIENDEKFKKLKKYFNKSNEFYFNDYDELKNENDIKKFDKITFKTYNIKKTMEDFNSYKNNNQK